MPLIKPIPLNKKTSAIIISIMLAISLVAVIFLTSFKINIFNNGFYKGEFQKYNIYEEFPNEDIGQINADILSYLKGKKDYFSAELFNKRELDHLKNVRSVIQKGNIFYYLISLISVILMIFLFLMDKKHFLRNISITLFFSGLTALAVTFTLLAMIALNFNSIFTIFHQLFFSQGTWLFSPSDNIIKLYPTEIFYDIAKNIFLNIIYYANILIGASILILKRW